MKTTKFKLIKSILKSLLCLTLVCILMADYALTIEPYMLLTHYYTLENPGDGSKTNLRIVQISDIQVSQTYNLDQLNKLVNKVNQTHPDILIFSGDLFENYAQYGPSKKVVKSLQKLEAKYGKFAIWGNRDYGGGAARSYESIIKKSGFMLLKNSSVAVPLDDGSKVLLAGLDDALLGKPSISKTVKGLKQPSDYKILLLHEPDIVDDFKNMPFDLILAGHSHGGQIYFPFVKGFTTALGEKYQRGFYHLNQNSSMTNSLTTNKKPVLYVNTGIGTSHYPIRFWVPPEIAVFDLAMKGNLN